MAHRDDDRLETPLGRIGGAQQGAPDAAGLADEVGVIATLSEWATFLA